MGTTCALLTCDQALLRDLHRLLEPEYSVVAMSDNVLSFSDALDSLVPDVAVVEMGVPVPYEGNLVRHVRTRYPDLAILVLADDAEQAAVQKLLSWGASGYVLKPSLASELCEAVGEVAQGKCYVSSGVGGWAK